MGMLGLLYTLGCLGLHASFGKPDTLAMLARLRASHTPPFARGTTRACLALDHEHAFSIVAVYPLQIFVCRRDRGRDGLPRDHVLETCVWTTKTDKVRAFSELRLWHDRTFPNASLVPGALPADERAAWLGEFA